MHNVFLGVYMRYFFYASLFFIISCSQTREAPDDKANGCISDNVSLTSSFTTGRMDECVQIENNHFLITLKPENEPINNSPWYAFKAQSQVEKTIKVTIAVSGDRANRYLPKFSYDKHTWHTLTDYQQEERLSFSIPVSTTPIYIAAQEIIDNDYYVNWANKLSLLYKTKVDILGYSSQNRPIYKIQTGDENKEWVVVLGRLHPPEVTGALALFPFVENLLSGTELAQRFRDKYNLLVIPNLNPDGVALGNWRHNANGFDLNRDWITLAQPETKLVHNYLQELAKKGHKVKFALDFHSTKHDVFYTMPVDYGVADKYFVKHWLANLDAATADFSVVQKPGNKPNNGVSKQYFADNYAVHAVTYEMGDETNRDKITKVALKASETLMQTILSNTEHDKE